MGTSAALTHNRRMYVGELLIRGYSVRQIAEVIRGEAAKPNSNLKGAEHTNYVTVANDVKVIKSEWLERDQTTLDGKRSEQISAYQQIIHQAWIDLQNRASKEGKEYLRPVYLRLIAETWEKITKLTGTQAPLEVTGANGDPLVPRAFRIVLADGTDIIPGRMGGNGHKKLTDGNTDNPAITD